MGGISTLSVGRSDYSLKDQVFVEGTAGVLRALSLHVQRLSFKKGRCTCGNQYIQTFNLMPSIHIGT